MTWEEFKKKAEKLGWYSITPSKEEVDLKSNGKNYQYFPKKYDEYVANENIPLTFYKDCSMFCDVNDIDIFPTLIQILSNYEQILIIMKALQ